MKREDIEKLLGGYAAGTLTPAERETLFAAALEDQQLFETLAREEPLRELLQDPAARGQLLASLAEAPEPWYYRPVHPALIFVATAGIVLCVVVIKFWPERQAAPLSVVATAPQPQPEKSPLPSDLRPFIVPRNISQRPGTRPALPTEPPPALLAQASPPPTPLAAPAAAPPPPPPAANDAIAVAGQALFKAQNLLAPTDRTAVVAGSVHDPARAALAGATITLTDQATDAITQVRTDARGEFRTAPLRTGEYSVRIEAPGFKRFEQSAVVLNTGEVHQVDAQLELGQAAESAQVQAAAAGGGGGAIAPAPPPPPARALAPAFRVAEALSSVNFGLRYTILKKQPGGTFAEVDPQQELDRKDEVVIRLQANESGYLYVLQRDAQNRWQPFASDSIQRSVPYTIPRSGSLRAKGSGPREFFVTFSRLPLSPTTRALAVPSQSGRQQGGQAGANAGPTTNVFTNIAEPAAQQVAFPITLKYK